MSIFRLIFASLRHHWRVQAAVACGVAAATAVICGALIVGDSMQGSLRRLTLDRLGRVELAMVTDRFFRAARADELAARARLDQRSATAVPVILIQSSLARPDSSQGAGSEDSGQSGGNEEPLAPGRANRVSLIGCDQRFWQLGPAGPAQPPDDGQIVLNRPLANLLGVEVGERVSVRVPRLGAISVDSPLGRKGKMARSEVLSVSDIIPADGLGGFSLSPNQQQPRNAFVSLEWLDDQLGQRARGRTTLRANAILVAGPPGAVEPVLDADAIRAALHPNLADYGIRIQKTARGYLNVTSERMILDPAAEEAILKAAQQLLPSPVSGEGPGVRVLTYLANTIACGKEAIPYSMIAAVDFASGPPFGPMLTPEGKPIAPLADDEIVLNTWAATELRAKPGDAIRVDYFEPESTHGQVRQQSRTFRLAAVVPLAGPAGDRDFTPEVPGLSDKDTIESWDLPSLIDTTRVHTRDEDYWRAYRGTPKAFISLAAGRRLWKSRFGQTTSLRIAGEGLGIGDWGLERTQSPIPNPQSPIPSLDIRLDPAAMGFVFQPVKRQGLDASVGTTPFQVLFLAFSTFLLASAAILVALLFRLGIERRAAEIGILLAVGLRRRQVTRLLAVEGFLVATAGGLAGIVLGIGYAGLLLVGLQTWWLGAVGTPFLRLYVAPGSLAVGCASGVVIALLAILVSVRRIGRNPPRQLLAGQACATASQKQCPPQNKSTSCPAPSSGTPSPPRVLVRLRMAAYALLVIALVLGLLAAWLSEEARAGAFFGAGALVLVALMVLIWTHLAAGSTGPAVSVGKSNLLRLAVRSAARNPTRSTLTVGLVAAACFLIVAVSAFRLDPSQGAAGRESGSGGFALVAESDQPVFHDLNTEKGRKDAGFKPEESQAVDGIEVIGLRVRPGDDASCRNLYQPHEPRVLGVPGALVERGGFAWAAALPQSERPGDGSSPNPWRLLDLDLGVDPDGVPLVPVILEKNTANYSLHLWKGVGQTYDIADDRGRKVRLSIVALLNNSIFQGDLLIGESAFVRCFPDRSGYRLLLIETAEGQDPKTIGSTLESALADYGLAVETARDRLAGFLAVQNTYLLAFQSLGALGLLLGTFGLAAVQMRSVLERRRELALMQATGFPRRMLARLIGLENGVLLGGGLACGILAALVAVLPHFFGGGASIPWGGLAAAILLVFVVGLLAGLAAARSVLAMPLVASLRSE